MFFFFVFFFLLFSFSSSSSLSTTTLHWLLFCTTSFQALLSFTTWLQFWGLASWIDHPLVLTPIGSQSWSPLISFMSSNILRYSQILLYFLLYTLHYFLLSSTAAVRYYFLYSILPYAALIKISCLILPFKT